MIRLGIHTAGSFCGASILKDGVVASSIARDMKRGHDQFLPEVCAEAANEAGVSLSGLSGISVCVGPGSFTGLRIGVAFARGLALSNDLVADGVTSLEALLGKPPESPTLVLLPAKRRLPDISFWAQIIRPDSVGEAFELEAKYLPDHLDEVSDILTDSDGASLLADVAPDLKPVIKSASPESVALWSQYSGAFPSRAPSPVYVREPDAIPAKSLVR